MDNLNQHLPEKRNLRFLLVIVPAVLAITAAGVYFYWQGRKDDDNKNHSQVVKQEQQNFSASSSPDNSATAASTSPAQSVTDDPYGLFVVTAVDKANNYVPAVKYRDDGIIQSGKYAGYHRLAAYETANDPGGGYTYIFATKDYKTYILDTGTLGPYQSYVYTDSDSAFNKSKVTAADAIPVDFPATINLGNFMLVRNAVYWDQLSPAGTELSASAAGLKFYSQPAEQAAAGDNPDAQYRDFVSVRNKYVTGSADIYAVDKAGLVFTYQLRSAESYDRVQADKDNNQMAYQNFYMSSDLVSNAITYNSYGLLFIYGCASPMASPLVLKNITDADLMKIGATAKGVDLYALRDAGSPINQGEYYAKVTASGQWFKDMNSVDPPAFNDYAAKKPVLVFKDPWNRWVGIGETELELVGGCGKPVIYLYPEKPEEVSVKFINPVNLSVNIPAYNNGWKVLAYPDGRLKDLRPGDTDCNKINFGLKGSEYASAACKSGIYPYLYWAGQAAGTYPTASGGWVVDRKDVAKFLDNKLSEIGLTEKEKADMTGYWVPELLKKDAPYYRLSFFLTQDMNKFIPMQVMPRPDSVLRVFLDWTPLPAKPGILPIPQILEKFARRGFVMVEWGGLKQ